MPNPNISAALTALEKTTMKANVDANKAIVAPFGVNLTPEQRRTKHKAGPDSISYVQDALQVGIDHPETVAGGLVIGEFQKDATLMSDINELRLHHAPYIEMLDDTYIAVSAENMNQADRIYEQVKILAKNDSNFELIRQQLSRRYENLRGPRTKTATQKVFLGPGMSATFIDVVPSSDLNNDGSTRLMLCDGALPVCALGNAVNAGTKVKIPAGVTTITVTNTSADTNASFSVKVTE
ncbi:MAG TPA: hypothetical protein VI757_00115 [Bacteroidia bacterium]|nr:hypothetical protein [Bacteroidia bacterium]